MNAIHNIYATCASIPCLQPGDFNRTIAQMMPKPAPIIAPKAPIKMNHDAKYFPVMLRWLNANGTMTPVDLMREYGQGMDYTLASKQMSAHVVTGRLKRTGATVPNPSTGRPMTVFALGDGIRRGRGRQPTNSGFCVDCGGPAPMRNADKSNSFRARCYSCSGKARRGAI